MTTLSAFAVALLVGLVAWQVRPAPAVRPLQPAALRPASRPLHRWWKFGRAAHVDGVAIASYMEALSRELRTGAALSGAFIALAPGNAMGTDAFDTARSLVGGGYPLADALRAVHAAGLHPDVALALQALTCAAAFGGPAAATLDACAAVLRERAAIAADVLSQSAQARLSARVLTVVPVGFALWSAAASERTRQAYLGSAVGLVSLALGASLNVGGWWWMRRIVTRGQR